MAEQGVVESRWSRVRGGEKCGLDTSRKGQRKRRTEGRVGVGGRDCDRSWDAENSESDGSEVYIWEFRDWREITPGGLRTAKEVGAGAWLGVCITLDSPTP